MVELDNSVALRLPNVRVLDGPVLIFHEALLRGVAPSITSPPVYESGMYARSHSKPTAMLTYVRVDLVRPRRIRVLRGGGRSCRRRVQESRRGMVALLRQPCNAGVVELGSISP